MLKVKRDFHEIEKMKNNGFYYDEDRDLFIKEGYGAFLTNVTLRDVNQIKNYVLSDPICLSMLKDGYELVSGPAAPSTDGIVYDKVAIYCKNYDKDDHKQLTDDKINSIVTEAAMLGSSYESLLSQKGNSDKVRTIIKGFKPFVSKIMETYSCEDIYRIIKGMDTFFVDGVDGKNTVDNMIIKNLKTFLYQHVITNEEVSEEDKALKKGRVSGALKEVEQVCETYKGIPVLLPGVPMSEEYPRNICIRMFEQKEVVEALISRFNEEYNASECRGIIAGLRKSYRENPSSTLLYITNKISDNIVDKTIDEYFGSKEKNKQNIKK